MKRLDEENTDKVSEEYSLWKKKIISHIESAKFNAALHVNKDLLQLYWDIGHEILISQ